MEETTLIEKNNHQPVLEPIIHEERLLPVLPLKNVVLLPKSIIPIIVGRPSSIEAVEYALRNDKAIFVTAQKSPDTEKPMQDDVYRLGTRALVLQVMRMPNRALKILAEGICRARIEKIDVLEGFLATTFQDLSTTETEHSKEFEAIWRHVKVLYQQYAQLNERAPQELINFTRTTEEIDYIADTIAVHLNLSFDDRQKILEETSLKKRLFDIAILIQKEIDILETEKRIQGQVQKQVEKNQREYYLTEQIKAINKELGRDDQSSEIGDLRDRVKKSGMSTEALEKCDKEIHKLEQMPAFSPEAVVSRNYVDWLTSIPWQKTSRDSISLVQAEKILNSSHAGLLKPKERILEFIAAQKYSGTMEKAPIICLVGPPGVGKTSLARAIAQSLGREFVGMSLGGVKDEAEIRGHRRTYIGALPGKIVQAMKKANTINPVVLLDEIDKLAQDITGDPASALLEVLDPDQNKTFSDHYLDVEYDLSKVMFIATANIMDNIPYPLLDRMELIGLAGYTEDEKVAIATNFLIPKKLKEYHVPKRVFKLPENILRTLINEYTKEAGVRQLDRIIAKLVRKAIQQFLIDKETKTIVITPERIKTWLGNAKFKQTSLDKQSHAIGVARGLAWTEVGGDILEIETTLFPGKANVTLTGQLGEIMQESAQASLSYIKSRARDLHIKKTVFSSNDIHLHLPEGATPKDGPSAGIAMACSLISTLTQEPLKQDIAMTGEITLRGRVLAIGGLKEKLLAAKRYGIKKVIVPHENYDDVQEILKEVEIGLEISYVQHMDEVVKLAFTIDPFIKSKSVACLKKH